MSSNRRRDSRDYWIDHRSGSSTQYPNTIDEEELDDNDEYYAETREQYYTFAPTQGHPSPNIGTNNMQYGYAPMQKQQGARECVANSQRQHHQQPSIYQRSSDYEQPSACQQPSTHQQQSTYQEPATCYQDPSTYNQPSPYQQQTAHPSAEAEQDPASYTPTRTDGSMDVNLPESVSEAGTDRRQCCPPPPDNEQPPVDRTGAFVAARRDSYDRREEFAHAPDTAMIRRAVSSRQQICDAEARAGHRGSRSEGRGGRA